MPNAHAVAVTTEREWRALGKAGITPARVREALRLAGASDLVALPRVKRSAVGLVSRGQSHVILPSADQAGMPVADYLRQQVTRYVAALEREAYASQLRGDGRTLALCLRTLIIAARDLGVKVNLNPQLKRKRDKHLGKKRA